MPEVRAPLLVHAGRRRAPKFVALEHSFHGRTIGALSVTSDEHYRAPFAPLLPGVTFVDPATIRGARRGGHARHRGDHRRADPGRRRRPAADAGVRGDAITDGVRATGALLIADEVQSGLGRTGHPFYSAALGLKPDLMAVGKALGAGVPIGAALVSEQVAATIAARRSRQHLRRQPARLPRGARASSTS